MFWSQFRFYSFIAPLQVNSVPILAKPFTSNTYKSQRHAGSRMPAPAQTEGMPKATLRRIKNVLTAGVSGGIIQSARESVVSRCP